LTPAYQASGLYLTKLGAELAGLGKECKNGNRTPWQLAEAALGDAALVPLWHEYQAAMHGRRILVLDKRAKALAARAPAEESPKQQFICQLWPEEVFEVGKKSRVIPGVWFELFEACRKGGPDPPKYFRQALDDLLEWREKAA
jgi:hypothetical protein